MLNKVSKCCGDRLISNGSSEGTQFYTCFNCKKSCDIADDCAECFPQHFPQEHFDHKTVPLCDKHYHNGEYSIKSEPEAAIKQPSSNNLEDLLDEIQTDVNRGYTVKNLKAFLLDLNPEHFDYRVVAQFVAKRIKELERQERMRAKKSKNI